MRDHGAFYSPEVGAVIKERLPVEELFGLGGDGEFRFGRMTEPHRLAASVTPEVMDQLALTMLDSRSDDTARDSPMPAGYTYFGQFIAHDLTHDIAAQVQPASGSIPDYGLGTPFFDLSGLYGTDGGALDSDTGKFHVPKISHPDEYNGYPESTSWVTLPRASNNGVGLAKIPDRRNDDNVILAHIHLLFMVFHNALMDSYGGTDLPAKIREVRQVVEHHYQWLVLNDYLGPWIVGRKRLKKALKTSPRFYNVADHLGTQKLIPLECAGAFFRYGHSQIRRLYRWASDDAAAARLVIALSGAGDLARTDLRPRWVMDWGHFFECSKKVIPNYARKIDSYISPDLSKLPHSGEGSLAARTLIRGLGSYELPDAQLFAEQLEFDKMMSSSEILASAGENEARQRLYLEHKMHEKTPLWLYTLLEAEKGGGDKLGPLAGAVVAEVMVGLMRVTNNSVLEGIDETTFESSPFKDEIANGKFSLSQLILWVNEKYPGALRL